MGLILLPGTFSSVYQKPARSSIDIDLSDRVRSPAQGIFEIMCFFAANQPEKRVNIELILSEKCVTLFVNYSSGGDLNESKCDF